MRSILIVDDEKMIRQGISTMIKNLECSFTNIFESKNGMEGMDVIEIEKISIVLTDISMPIMNGIELIKRISASQYNPKIIIISAYEDFKYAQEAIKYGVCAYLVKPIDRNELQCLILEIEKQLSDDFLDIIEPEYARDSLIKNKHIPKIVEIALDYIDTNYKKDIDLAVVSNYVSLNYCYFSQIFKTTTGLNFLDYLKKLRIQKSKILLCETNYKIYEIAEKCGFSNSKQYMKVFRNETNSSPSQYRQKLQI
jgi:two-component system, response regulator YesN